MTNDQPMMTIAACDACGMGYLKVSRAGVKCFCGDGHVWFLPEAEITERVSTTKGRLIRLAHQRLTEPPSLEPRRDRTDD